MRRAIACGLLACGCTIENPAFELGMTGGATTVDAGDTSAAPSTSAPPATTTEATTEATTGVTSEPPATASSSDDATTADLVSGSSHGDSGDATTDAPLCPVFDHPLGPRLRLLTGDGLQIPTELCQDWTSQPMIAGIVKSAGPDAGFTIEPKDGCKLADVGKLYFGPELPMPELQGEPCGVLRFGIHDALAECTPAWFVVSPMGKPSEVMLFGRFGAHEPAPPGFPALAVSLAEQDPCGCDGCCPGDAKAPGRYRLAVGEGAIDEGGELKISLDGGVFQLRNVRSHVHDECDDPGMAPVWWKHVDWVALRTDP